jgi:2-polyprenyl-6-methoxyphenol hydroxylase-like FAD-dependent oxidoreductase
MQDTVLIVGGGPAGLALAIELSQTGVHVWVAELSNYTEPRIGEHLPPSAIQALNSLVPGRLLSGAVHQSSGGVDAFWGGSTPSHMDYLFHPIGAGANLSRPTFDRDLAMSCRDAGATVALSAVLASAAWKGTHWSTTLRLPSGSIELSPRLIVDATGRRASFARTQGASIVADDQQIAVTRMQPRTHRTESNGGGRVLVEATENGWWYFAPLASGSSVATYMTDADMLPHGGKKALREWWIDQVRSTDHVKANVIDHRGSESGFLVRWARSQRLSHASGKGWFAVGDAACAFDPLASRGIAKGLEGARQSADLVSRYLSGGAGVLREYADLAVEAYDDYRRLHSAYYLMETRWPSAQFWHRRQGSE